MFHPAILKTFAFYRTQQQMNPVDACGDTAAFYGVPIDAFAAWLLTMGVEPLTGRGLSLLTP